MKKLLMMLAVASLSVGAVAQDVIPYEKYSVSTRPFWSNWFVQGNVTWGAWYAHERALVRPFHKFPTGEGHTGLGASLAIGKWFTPGLGLRTKVNAWRVGSKMTVDGVDIKPNEYWAANEQVLFNLSNLFLGYNEKRIWSLIPYIGAGVNRDMTANHYSTQLNCGVLNMFRISRKLAANLEIGWNTYESDNSGLGIKSRINQFTLEVGLTYNLGKSTFKKSPDVETLESLHQSQLDALNAQLDDMQAENDRLRGMLDSKPQPQTAAPQTVTKVVAAPVSVFFSIGKSVIESPKDLQNVADLVKVAQQHQSKLVVTGYADSETGSADYNRQLSAKRAEAVAAELVKMGVGRDQIETVAAGGVDTLNPQAYNRRATVELK
ncbi:MAG: OmpA family protein [Bacteroidales bacterium]|nr:OmpA family protein [Bacteroidales bacterium]